VRASTVSYTEWAAEVEYSVNPLVKGPPRPNVSVSVGRVRGDARSPFDTPRGAQVIRLTGPSVNVSVEQSPQLKYRFHSQYASQRDFAATLDMLYGKPETLRDEMLADIEALRQQAKEQLAKNWHLRIYDERGATSAEPPRETPVFDEQQQPNAATRKALAGEVERKLGAQEAAIRDDFREIHAAVQRALPLRELLDSDASK
jgi:hypothetical protein